MSHRQAPLASAFPMSVVLNHPAVEMAAAQVLGFP